MVHLTGSRTFRSSHHYPQEFLGCNLATESNRRNYSLRNLGWQMVCLSLLDPMHSTFQEFLIRLHAMGEMESCRRNGGSSILHRTLGSVIRTLEFVLPECLRRTLEYRNHRSLVCACTLRRIPWRAHRRWRYVIDRRRSSGTLSATPREQCSPLRPTRNANVSKTVFQIKIKTN